MAFIRTLPLALVLIISLALGVGPAGAADPYPGVYRGSAQGITAKLEVGKSLEGRLAYRLKTPCGKTQGKIALGRAKNGKFSGRRVSRAPKGSLRTIVAKLRVIDKGERAKIKVKDSLSGGGLGGCHGKRRVVARLDKTGGGGDDGENGIVPERDTGHYLGSSQDGHPISFDLVETEDGYAFENFAVDVQVECWEDLDEDGFDDVIVAHVSGLRGPVGKTGELYLDHTPDENTAYTIDGTVAKGVATLDVTVGGYFDLDGNPSASGPYSCDSWGAIYEARRQP